MGENGQYNVRKHQIINNMANRNKNWKERRTQKIISRIVEAEKRKGVLAHIVGKEVVMSDRSYVIMPNGSYKRLQTKQEIRYSAKREKVLARARE
jgi:hypothetical protein